MADKLKSASVEIASQDDAALVVAMAQQALEDAALIEGARLGLIEAAAFFAVDGKVN